ncbi:MAG: proline--tRNA ligase [Chlamydiales bacterium]
MRRTDLFSKTFKESPSDAEAISHQLLERGGYIKRIGKGIYIHTPLMLRVIKKLLKIIRYELDKTGAQELAFPMLHPAHYWKKSGRWDDYISENLLYTIQDREGHPYCLAPTHEEISVALASSWITSYRDLPCNLYQIGNKFRDEIRTRFGLIRGKEFLMKDGYSFSSNPEEMEKQYQAMRLAYSNILNHLELKFIINQAHGGKIGKGKSEEFQVIADIGEDVIMTCGAYAVNVEAADSIPPTYSYDTILKEKKILKTPDIKTIQELTTYLKVDSQKILKTLVYKLIYSDRKEYIAIGIRGDRQVNQRKLEEKFGALDVLLATEDEVKKVANLPLGFIGPLKSKLPFYADKTTEAMTNFICAGNKKNIHYLNVNWEYDLPKPNFDDFLLAEEGDLCPNVPTGVYQSQRGIEVGHIFNIGTKYTEKLGGFYRSEHGEMEPIWMGTYGIGIDRLAAACVEQSHDTKGIIWPKVIAPFQIMITAAHHKETSLNQIAENLYTILSPFDPLIDDRKERLGFKLKDSDLIGIPYKMIVGKKYTDEGKIEIESRLGSKEWLSIEELENWAQKNLNV